MIVPCYILPDKDNELLRFTRQCLASLRRYCRDFELILVDNGSPVGGEFLRAEADVYVRNRKNLGYAKAVNQGLKLAEGDYLAVSNNDVVFIHDWLSTAVAAWDERTGAISSHLHEHDEGHRVGRMVVPWGHMMGALWMTSRQVVEEVGYLSEEYELGHYEDKEFWLTIRQAGYELVKVGWCKHVGNATCGKLPGFRAMFFRNKERFERRWADMIRPGA